jgi:outer membrane PBP1 activator LpoA protein
MMKRTSVPQSPRRNALAALVLVALGVLALPALSVAQSPPASEPPARRMVPPEPEATKPAAPATDAMPVEPAPAPEPVAIALVLPLESPTYRRAADAVRAGFAAAADAAGEKFTTIAHGDGDVRAAFDKARAGGARVVVGPLVRDDLKAIAGAGTELPWTIALNQLDEGTVLPDRVYTLALSTESDGRQLARRAHGDGVQTIAVVASDSPLQKRFAGAFVGEWVLQGDAPPQTYRMDRSPDVLALLRRELIKAQPSAVLLAVDAQDAALVKPYLGQVAVYTSGQVNDRQGKEGRNDLDAVVFVEIPWLADPGSTAFARIPRKEFPNASLDRLYALGLDAFHVAQAFVAGAPPRLEFDGATGHLTLDASRQFLREGTLLQFRGGDIVPVASR